MNRVLLVDDDPDQLRLLARALSARGPGMRVITAADGQRAVEHLQRKEIDLVLTDLQMPDMNGFELLVWLTSHQPHVPVFTMTAYYDDEAASRLRDLGDVECFVKPLDVAEVSGRIHATLERGLRGQLRNLSLASLLQLVEMERQTCTLSVGSEDRVGHLFVREGAIIDARLDELEGEEAAIQMTSWPFPVVTIASACRTRRRTVERPLRFVIMEAMRRLDERGRDDAPSEGALEEALGEAFDTERPAAGPVAPTAEDPSGQVARSPSSFPAPTPAEADAVLIVDGDGRVRRMAGSHPDAAALAQVVAEVYRGKVQVVQRLGLNDVIEELVFTGARQWVLARPLAERPGTLVVGLYDRDRVNYALNRRELSGYVEALEAWLAGES